MDLGDNHAWVLCRVFSLEQSYITRTRAYADKESQMYSHLFHSSVSELSDDNSSISYLSSMAIVFEQDSLSYSNAGYAQALSEIFGDELEGEAA
jgi:formylmethanofuran dehydrogenase subunit E-like metal-binding protein